MATVLVILISFLFTFLNSINFFSGLVNQKAGEVYLGTTHYFEDYFFYLSQFLQGANGSWLTANLYTSEATEPSILFWPNILFGKIGGLLGLTPMLSYNLSIIVITFIILITIYFIQRRIFDNQPLHAFIAFLITVTSTSFMNRILVDGKPMWYPFQLWKTPNFALDRLGAVPHQLVQTLLFLMLTHVLLFKKQNKNLFLAILVVLLTSLNPVMAGLFVAASWISGRGNFLVSIVFLFTAFYYNSLANAVPHIQSKLWEAGQQITTTPLFMLLSIGPVSVLGIIGALRVRKNIFVFGTVLLSICYLLFFSPIPKLLGISNSRVLFPALYVFWGALATYGIFSISKRPAYCFLLIVLFFVFTVPALVWEVQQKLVVQPHERVPLLYLPKNVYDGFIFLKNRINFDDIVLASPTSHMDAMIPALTGHTSFTGHPFATINSNEKKALASKFFGQQMTSGEGRKWLGEQNIKYIFHTSFDGDKLKYNFLKKIYDTPSVTIYGN